MLSVLVLLLPMTGAAQDVSKQRSRKAALEKEIAILDGQLRDNASRSASALNKLTLTRKKVDVRRALIKESDREISALMDSIDAKQAQIIRLQTRLDTMTVRYAALVRTAYRNRSPQLVAMLLLSSDDFAQAGRRYVYLRKISGAMNTQAAAIKEAQASLTLEKQHLESLRKDADILRSSRKAELRTLSREEAASAKVVSQLKRDKSRYQKQLAEKRRQVDALNKEISRIISKATSSKTARALKPEELKLSSEFAANKGKLPWPADGSVVDHFGQHYHPVYTNVKLPFNNGVSVAVRPGTEVKAVFDGVVSQIIVMPGYHQCILVQHGAYFTFYCKLAKVMVKAGDKVRTGQPLGVVDTISGETQVHFQLWNGKDPEDPEDWLL